MDSRNMSKIRFSGEQGATGGKRSKQKVYCIFEKEGHIYFPIAAKWSPYYLKNNVEKESYLAGMPNFFGGNVEGRESVEQALAREIREESQGKIHVEIPAGALGETIFMSRPKETDMDRNTYAFYILRRENCILRNFQWEGENVFGLCPFHKGGESAKEHPESFEDSCLVKMDRGCLQAFMGRLRDLVTNEEARKAEIGSILEGLGITDITSTVSISNWYSSHTFTAFMESLTRM